MPAIPALSTCKMLVLLTRRHEKCPRLAEGRGRTNRTAEQPPREILSRLMLEPVRDNSENRISPPCCPIAFPGQSDYFGERARTTTSLAERLTMALQDEISAKAAEIKTDSYQMSIGEIINLYKAGEIDVHPEFQRIYRWSETQKTRLIESLLLGIPLPPIFVAQRRDGIWDVVDGVQRLSTILQFVGVLRDDNKKLIPPLVLEKTEYLPSLKGMKWEDQKKKAKSFTDVERLYIKRAKLDVNIVLKESDDQSKFELFMRLNTGGSPLSPQEVRNCLLVMANRETYLWLKTLSDNSAFLETIALSERAIDEKYHMELALRFLIFRRLEVPKLKGLGDIGEFLDKNLTAIAKYDNKKKTLEEKAFTATFGLIQKSLEDFGFHKYDSNKKRFTGAFSISAFEAIALGIGYHIITDGAKLTAQQVLKNAREMWSNSQFISNSGSGIRASTRIPQIIPLGRKVFKP